ncbi:hypothetical protein NPA31_000790 [Aurantimonas sp. MSK8Z-1]|nr:hypothetical protein [Aurantimonas sp. MSK8Z-1]MCW4113495.1 hypothetical protein [Aurantimonas sp. MSK8Z-1]
MAKGQQRSNKEVRKPKKDKTAAAAASATPPLGKGSLGSDKTKGKS